MGWIGGVLLVSGWAIVVAALLLFGGLGERVAFVVAGLLVEILGLGLVGHSFTLRQRAPAPSSTRRSR